MGCCWLGGKEEKDSYSEDNISIYKEKLGKNLKKCVLSLLVVNAYGNMSEKRFFGISCSVFCRFLLNL